jgi:hypothetical protein
MAVTVPNIKAALSADVQGLGTAVGITLPSNDTINVEWKTTALYDFAVQSMAPPLADQVAAVLLANHSVKSVTFTAFSNGTVVFSVTRSR